MTNEEELEHLRAEKTRWCELLQQKDEKPEQSHQANQTLREGLKQAIIAIESLQEHVKTLEGLIASQQERIKILEGQQARDSHNSSLPPSSDRFVRPPKSLRQKSGKKAGGQLGHRGHHLQRVETPDEILIHQVERCEHCQYDLLRQTADLPERRQVMDLLLAMKAEVEQAKALGQHDLDVLVLARLLCRYDAILKEGYQANPPPPPPRKSEQSKRKPGRAKQNPARNLLDRLSLHKWVVLRFLHDFAVPFDNDLVAYCTPFGR